jgi:uncharacterized protein YdeI (YjbR/CyaY-like superfamily)
VTGETKQGLAIVQFADASAWERWLEENHAQPAGVWLKFAKKGSPTPTVNYDAALEVALCFGWIDGQVARYDASFYLQRFTPRRARSKWSEINRQRADALIAAGRMRAAGLAQVRAAQADGRWDQAYAPASRISVPDDLQAALDANAAAAEFFAGLTGSTRYAFLYRLHHVTSPAARSRRIADYIERLSEGRTLDGR